MSEHTDAARLEATRDAIRTGTAPRPRVEGEAVRRPLDRTLVRLYAEFTDAECAIHGDAGVVIRDLALNVLDERASIASLTAEVERLTKEKARACQMAFEEGAIWGYTGPTGAAIQAEAELRYPLPTPAPEAKDA